MRGRRGRRGSGGKGRGGRRTLRAAALAVAGVTAVVVGCSAGERDAAQAGETRQDEVRQLAATASPAPSGSPSVQPGDGKLTVVYETGTEVGDDEAQRFLEKRKVLEDAAGYANSIVGLAYDVPVKGTSCDGAAFWSNDSKDITVCYAFVAELRDIFGRQQTASPDVDKQTVGMINGALFHELGHALVAMYRLPVTGREEDAVDQLSVLLMAAGDERHHDYAIDSINAWGAMADAEQGVPKPFDGYADEHSLNAQRFFNWTCWLYGSDPEAYASLVQSEKNPDGVLPEERAERCPSEFQQLDESWSTLLQPYLKASST